MVVCLSIVAVIRFYYQQEENISSKETKPVDIGGIRSFCREQKIRWKAHALERMIMRGIAKADAVIAQAIRICDNLTGCRSAGGLSFLF